MDYYAREPREAEKITHFSLVGMTFLKLLLELLRLQPMTVQTWQR